MKRTIVGMITLLLIVSMAGAAITVTTVTERGRTKTSNKWVIVADVVFSGTYATNGFYLNKSTTSHTDCAKIFGLNVVDAIIPTDAAEGGYTYSYEPATKKILMYFPLSVHTHAVALDGGASAAGASHNHAYTGTAPLGDLNLATPAFSGTGLTAAGQVITTTDNQTMTLNQCAGMWLLAATGATPPMLILSNTAVAPAPAVLTVQGAAGTDAGAYKIVKDLTPVGTNTAEATHTHAWGTLADAASAASTAAVGTEITAATNVGTRTLTMVVIGQ